MIFQWLFAILCSVFNIGCRLGCHGNSCRSCLTKSGRCAWAANECLGSCLEIQDASCYSAIYFLYGMSRDEICAQAYRDEADAKICHSKDSCESCTATVLSDGINTCQWFHQDVTYCGSECSWDGCGTKTCEESVPST